MRARAVIVVISGVLASTVLFAIGGPVRAAEGRQAQALDERHVQVNGLDRTYLIHRPAA
jgi:poly(3-hydroxybutyrate) depolymerase